MLEVYYTILSLLRSILEELEDDPVVVDIQKTIDHFKSRESNFQKNVMKIVIIGSTSVGKSTFINKIVERDLYGTETLHGTSAFFYTTCTSKDYEYFTINDTHEIKDVKCLKHATKLKQHLQGYIDEDTKITTYILSNNNQFLNTSSVFVDSPGLEQEKTYKQKITDQCENAGIIIFLFDVEQLARKQEMEFLKQIFECNKTFFPFFVYNKCDTVELNDDSMADLRKGFLKTFKDLFEIYCKMDKERLYFLSAIQSGDTINNSLNDDEFVRFKNDLLKYIDVGLIRFHHVFSQCTKELEKVKGVLQDILKRKTKSKNDTVREIKATEKIIQSMKSTHESLVREMKAEAEYSMDLLKLKDIDSDINRAITDFKGSCDKHNAEKMFNRMKDSIDNVIKQILQLHINIHWQKDITRSIDDPNFSKLENKFVLSENLDGKFCNVNFDKNIFWWFEFGDKTSKVKEHFQKCITDKLSPILDKIYNYYKTEVTQFGKEIDGTFAKQLNLKICQSELKTAESEKLTGLIDAIQKYSGDIRDVTVKMKQQLEYKG